MMYTAMLYIINDLLSLIINSGSAHMMKCLLIKKKMIDSLYNHSSSHWECSRDFQQIYVTQMRIDKP